MRNPFSSLVLCSLIIFLSSCTALPGNSFTNSNLKVRDRTYTMVQASITAGARCNDPIKVIDTKITRKPIQKISNVKGVSLKIIMWSETWTISACGGKFLVPIDFLTDKTSGNTSVRSNYGNIKKVG